ncbi:MAG: MerR family DNA-binding transcriptional regulator [Pseudomonadota bacterium]|nr:MerR family DNA-binding transcriptional regulator [Pseudomonadota bacterium]
MTETKTWSIRDLSIEFDITPRTLRFYEDKGLINPTRKGTQRIYDRRDKGRLALILRGKRLGFSLAEIRDWLDLYDLRDGQVAQAQVLMTASRQRMSALEQQRRDLDETIRELQGQMAQVESWLKQHSQPIEAVPAEAAD